MVEAPSTKKTPETPKKTSKPTAKPAAPKTVPVKGAAKPATAARGGAPSGPVGRDVYDVVFHPIVTEKTMFNMDKNNSLEFLVHTTANKPSIAQAVEALFSVKVQKVTTRITKDGKRAVVRFAEGYSAEDVGMRIGVF